MLKNLSTDKEFSSDILYTGDLNAYKLNIGDLTALVGSGVKLIGKKANGTAVSQAFFIASVNTEIVLHSSFYDTEGPLELFVQIVQEGSVLTQCTVQFEVEAVPNTYTESADVIVILNSVIVGIAEAKAELAAHALVQDVHMTLVDVAEAPSADVYDTYTDYGRYKFTFSYYDGSDLVEKITFLRVFPNFYGAEVTTNQKLTSEGGTYQRMYNLGAWSPWDVHITQSALDTAMGDLDAVYAEILGV